MTKSIQTKFECQTVTKDKHGRTTVKLSAVFGVGGENKIYWDSVPDGQIEICLKDIEAASMFVPGAEYYVNVSSAAIAEVETLKNEE